MKKFNNKGFVMAETIVVSTVVIAALILIYTQFVSINNGYYRSFKYNTVNNLYATNNIKKYISSYFEDITDSLGDDNYINITTCPAEIFSDYNYCSTLFDAVNVETVLVAKYNLDSLKQEINNNNSFSEKMNSFIKNINYNGNYNYRLIVEFKDETFATLIMDDMG